jgi:hypothetical protein
MFSILLISLGLNTALMFILAGLASVFYGTPAQPIFSTIAVFTVFFDLILPFILLWAHFNRADSTRRPPRYPRRPVGDEAGLDEATARWHLLEALEKHAAVFSYLAAAEQRENRAAPSEADRALTAMEQRQVKNNIYRYQHPTTPTKPPWPRTGRTSGTTCAWRRPALSPPLSTVTRWKNTPTAPGTCRA